MSSNGVSTMVPNEGTCPAEAQSAKVVFPSKPRHVPAMYSIPLDQPVVPLDASGAFRALNQREQLYAHHLARASFYGGLIVLLQTSLESPQIYRLIQLINAAEDVEDLKKSLLCSDDFTVEDFQAFLVYCSGVLTNMGNYKGFGDSKFIPDLTVEKFEKIVKSSKAYRDNPRLLEEVWNSVKEPLFGLSDQAKQLGLGSRGVTKYFSANCNQADADLVNKFFKAKKLEGYMNRVIKTTEGGKNVYEIRTAASDDSVIMEKTSFEGADFIVTAGDYNQLLDKVNKELELAQKYAANDNESNMIKKYGESFKQGSLDAHKDGSRFWIKNKGPMVETYIGFIETYRDPVGMRGEFEGFVAMVNKEQSTMFQELVEKAETFLPRLPWPKEFEKDVFLRPDFTSLDVLAFAGSGIPAGINIPNYDEIRQSEGFKNVNLGNVITASYKADRSPFLRLEDHELMEKYRVKSFEVQVGLHELLGHGSGKLLQIEEKNNSFNFDKATIDPLTGKPVAMWYDVGETYDSKFTAMGSSYEECRAECVGLYLSCDKDVLEIFRHQGADLQSDIVYTNWLSLCHAALKGLETFSPASMEWKQAHSQARFVILQVLLEAGEGFVSVKPVTGEDGKPDLLLSMDRSKIESVGKPAIGSFLQKLQVYKSTGNVVAAEEMYNKYSAVNNDDKAFPWAQWRDIILDRKQPRKMLVQANTIIKDEKLSIVDYDSSHEGMMRSWKERFSAEEHKEIDQILDNLYKKDLPHF